MKTVRQSIWEASSRSASKEILHLLRNLNFNTILPTVVSCREPVKSTPHDQDLCQV
jgi:hypothetical protein